MKKIIYVIFVFLIYFNYAHSNYWNVNMTTLSAVENSCSVTVNARYYLGETTYLYDLLWHSQLSASKDWLIGFSSSKVGVYNPNNHIQINDGFQFTSRVLPSNESSVVAMFNLAGTKMMTHPANRNDLAAQIVYEVSVAPTAPGTNTSTLWYSTYSNNVWENKNRTINNFLVDTGKLYTEKECFNVFVSWCWDWVKDTQEQCDPNDPAKTGWGSWGCDNTCKPITPPSGSTQCINLTANPSSGSRPLNTTFTCNTNGASSYEIKITDSTGNVVRTMNPTPNGQVGTGSHTFPSTGTYTASCYINGRDTTPAACTTTVTVTEWGGWSSSSSSSSSSSWWGSSSGGWSSGGGWGWNYCGDWTLQRPNNQMIYEECDFGWSTPWSNWPAWCGKPDSWENACKIIENTQPGWGTDRNNTQPGWGDISLSPWDTLLLGWWMWVFEYLSSNNATITNSSTSDIFIDKRLCVYKQWFNYGSMSGNSICSTNVIGQLAKNWWVKKLSIADDRFVADISSFPSGITSTDGQIITTLEWLQNSSTFSRSILKVRVAKPSVNTVWWWASLLDGTKLSDVSKLSKDMWPLNAEVNKNLILTSLWSNPLSSYTKTVNDTKLVNKSKTDGQKDLSAFDQNFSTGTVQTINKLPTQKYNWFDNIFTHNGNVSLSSQKIEWGNKTYIIENGNLTIKWNITSTDNILFVVKQGNVIIENAVTQLDAIIINIWWKVIWDTSSTTNRLVVNGALYGNVDDLLANRTYIKDRWEYIDVGTNINFTSKVFSSPPPLLSKFLWEYMEGNKIPK